MNYFHLDTCLMVNYNGGTNIGSMQHRAKKTNIRADSAMSVLFWAISV